MKRLLLSATCASLLGQALQAQRSPTDSAAAAAAVEQYDAALAAGDSAKVVALLADDVLILESGAIQTRAQYLSGHLSADMKAKQGNKGVRSIIQVTLVGDAALVVTKGVTPTSPPPNSSAQPGVPTGNFVSELAELMVVSKTPAGWKIRAIHWSSRRRRA